MFLTPEIHGSVTTHSAPDRFVEAFRRRVEAGLLTGRPHRRSNYRVVRSDSTGVTVTAVGLPTALNVGLNEIDLRLPFKGGVRYRVSYWRWTGYGVFLSALLGLVGVVMLLAFDARTYIETHVASRWPGLSVDQNLAIAWGMVIFWGFVWPWIMVPLHKRSLRRLIERIITDVDG
jgi:hypothetical protein